MPYASAPIRSATHLHRRQAVVTFGVAALEPDGTIRCQKHGTLWVGESPALKHIQTTRPDAVSTVDADGTGRRAAGHLPEDGLTLADYNDHIHKLLSMAHGKRRRPASTYAAAVVVVAWFLVLAGLMVVVPWMKRDEVQLAGPLAFLLHHLGVQKLPLTHPAICRFIPRTELYQQVKRRAIGFPSKQGDLPQPAAPYCKAVEEACHEDSLCHVTEWESTLARPMCQKLMKGQACSSRYQGQPGPAMANAEACRLCRHAKEQDELHCSKLRQTCDKELSKCFLSRYGPMGWGSLQWMSFWDENSYSPTEFSGWANFGFTANISQICYGASLGMWHMLKVHAVFFQRASERDRKGRQRIELVPSWRDNWDRMRGDVANLLASGAIFGLYLGDELVWNGLPPEHLEWVAAAVRTDFPGIITWVNEAKPPIKNGVTQFDRHKGGYQLPQSVSWVSVDGYHFGPDPEHVIEARRFHFRYLYPKLLANQSVVLVPGAFSSAYNNRCDAICYEQYMQDDALQFMQWSKLDDKVVAVAPYHWNSCPHCRATRNEIGARDLNGTREVWLGFGRQIQAARDHELADICHVHYRPDSNITLFQCLAKRGSL